MNDTLRKQLTAAGWRPGRYKGSLQTNRAGIEFHLGRSAGADRLELRYVYRTERTNAEGDVSLPLDAAIDAVQDAVADVYLRVHEKPDYGRVFGARRRARRKEDAPAAPAEAPEAPPSGQTTLDL